MNFFKQVAAILLISLIFSLLVLLLLLVSKKLQRLKKVEKGSDGELRDAAVALNEFASCDLNFAPMYVDPRRLSSAQEIGAKPWSKKRKYKVFVDGLPHVMKTTLANFELVYFSIGLLLNLEHAKTFQPTFTVLNGQIATLGPFVERVENSWNTSVFCAANTHDRAAFHVLFNDFLLGYGDRAPNCHIFHGTVVPIDQDSGSYTALLPPQEDKMYEKHILHNALLRQDAGTITSFKKHMRCTSFDLNYQRLAACLPGVFVQFPLHSTRLRHVLFRFNESFDLACWGRRRSFRASVPLRDPFYDR